MGKLRNAPTDIGQFAQWMARKCKNHNPLEELGLKQVKMPNMYKAKGKGAVSILEEDPSVIVYEAGGRVFSITVREEEDSAFEGKARLKVGA